ncbi:hypothetical protein TNCV_3010111 [Trichonephila clavipes]|nr:hypothetical protein TNCV_3010111 [Trichonephila clavipes]
MRRQSFWRDRLSTCIRSERKVPRTNLPSNIGDPGRDMSRNLRARRSRGAIYPPQKQPNHQTLTQISRYFSKSSHTSDATAYMLATNMVSVVRLFAETLVGEYAAVGYLYELVPASREDDCFDVIG